MKKTKARLLTLIMVSCMALTACSQKTVTTTDVTEESSTAVETEKNTEDFEPVIINMENLVNTESGGRPVVTVHGDDGVLLSFDFSEMVTSEVEVTLDKPVEEEYFYVTMAGNVTRHTLESDGSLFDGIADIVDGKAAFDVEYDEGKIVHININVPV